MPATPRPQDNLKACFRAGPVRDQIQGYLALPYSFSAGDNIRMIVRSGLHPNTTGQTKARRKEALNQACFQAAVGMECGALLLLMLLSLLLSLLLLLSDALGRPHARLRLLIKHGVDGEHEFRTAAQAKPQQEDVMALLIECGMDARCIVACFAQLTRAQDLESDALQQALYNKQEVSDLHEKLSNLVCQGGPATCYEWQFEDATGWHSVAVTANEDYARVLDIDE